MKNIESDAAGKIKTAFKKLYERLIKIRGTPKDIAFGFSLGIFIGMTPTMGFQMAMAVFMASLLKCSKIAAAIGVWITNPLTAPFVYGTTYYIGTKLLGVRAYNLIQDEIHQTALHTLLKKAPGILWHLTVGGIVVGIPLALISYYIVYSAVTKYQADIKKQIEKQKEKLKMKREKSRNKKKNNSSASLKIP